MWMRVEVRDGDPMSSVGVGRQKQMASRRTEGIIPQQE